MSDRALNHIRQHCVRAAKRDQCGFGKEPAHLGQRARPALQRNQHAHGQNPEQRAAQRNPGAARYAEQGVRRGRGVVIDNGAAVVLLLPALAGGEAEITGRIFAADKTAKRRARHDERKREIEYQQGEQGERGDAPQSGISQCARADALRRLQDDCNHCRFDAVKKSADQRGVAERDISPTQADQNKQGR